MNLNENDSSENEFRLQVNFRVKQSYFHMHERVALGLAWKMRNKVTREWPITVSLKSLSPHVICKSHLKERKS